MRGDQLARQWRILRRIEASTEGCTVQELAREEGVSVRTAYRDLEALQYAGFPLFSEKVDQTSKWAFVDTYRFQLPQPFSLTELMSLHLYGDLVKVFEGTAFFDSLLSLFKKVKATLPPQALSYLDKIQTTFSVGIKPYKDYGRFREILNQVNTAALERKRIEIAYQALRSDQETVRKIDPYKIWFFEGTIYLIGFCHLRDRIRVFVLDRIRMLQLTEEDFEIPEGFDFKDYMASSFKVMHDELHTVVIRISRDWARWVGEKIWHESQKAEKLKDGSLELTFRVAGLDEIRMWVLSLGSQAWVVSPRELKNRIYEELRATERFYGEDAQEAVRNTPGVG